MAGEPLEDAAEARLRVAEELGLVLHAMVVDAALTKRQRKILELYYFEGRTQIEVARALGITQPSVVQHLLGKKRGDRYVGGALNKLRNAIHKAALRLRTVATRTAQIIRVMDERLDRARARQRSQRLMAEQTGTRQRHGSRRNNKKK